MRSTLGGKLFPALPNHRTRSGRGTTGAECDMPVVAYYHSVCHRCPALATRSGSPIQNPKSKIPSLRPLRLCGELNLRFNNPQAFAPIPQGIAPNSQAIAPNPQAKAADSQAKPARFRRSCQTFEGLHERWTKKSSRDKTACAAQPAQFAPQCARAEFHSSFILNPSSFYNKGIRWRLADPVAILHLDGMNERAASGEWLVPSGKVPRAATCH